MARKASITWLSGVCRVGEECETYGDPYEIAFTLQWIDDETYEMIGVDKPLSRDDRIAIINACEADGITNLKTRRINSSGEARSRLTDVSRVHNTQREEPPDGITDR